MSQSPEATAFVITVITFGRSHPPLYSSKKSVYFYPFVNPADCPFTVFIKKLLILDLLYPKWPFLAADFPQLQFHQFTEYDLLKIQHFRSFMTSEQIGIVAFAQFNKLIQPWLFFTFSHKSFSLCPFSTLLLFFSNTNFIVNSIACLNKNKTGIHI